MLPASFLRHKDKHKGIGKDIGERNVMREVILDLQDIKKSFGKNEILKGLNLKVHEGEFLTFLGASGCGKTTTLRIIAGLEMPDSGQVILNGVDVTKKEPNERDVNTVFQNYALFPHMSVEDNIAYGLKLKKVAKNEIQKSSRGKKQGYQETVVSWRPKNQVIVTSVKCC